MWQAYKAVWQNTKQQGSHLVILLALAEFADNEGLCYPSIGTLADMANVEHRQVRRILQHLRDQGEIEIWQGGGRNGSNLYRIVAVEGLTTEKKSTNGQLSFGMKQAAPRKPRPPEGEGAQTLGKTPMNTGEQVPPTGCPDPAPQGDGGTKGGCAGPKGEGAQPPQTNKEPEEPPKEPTEVSFSEAEAPKLGSVDLFTQTVHGFSLPGPLATVQHEEAWQAYVEMRKKKQAPMTPRVLKRILKDLLEWGPDHALAALWKSAKSCWVDLYPPKEANTPGAKNEKGGKAQVTHATVL